MFADHFAGATNRAELSGLTDAQINMGFPAEAAPSSRVRAKRREADWRRQLARAFVYVAGKSPEHAEELIAEYEQREREGPDFLRERPGSIIAEAPLVNLDGNDLARLWVKFRTLDRRSWEAKEPGKHRGAVTRCMEAVFQALTYLVKKYRRVHPSLVGLAHLSRCCKQSVVDALAELEKLGFVTRIRRLKQVDTPLGFKTQQDCNAYVVHEPKSGLGLLAIRTFNPESSYPSPSEAYDSNLATGERYEGWLDPDSPLGRGLDKLLAAIMRRKQSPVGAG